MNISTYKEIKQMLIKNSLILISNSKTFVVIYNNLNWSCLLITYISKNGVYKLFIKTYLK